MNLDEILKLQDELIRQLGECNDTERSIEISLEIRNLKEEISKKAQELVDENLFESLFTKMTLLNGLSEDEINILIKEFSKAAIINIKNGQYEDAADEIEDLKRLSLALHVRNKANR